MSSGRRNTHWCYHCSQPVRPRRLNLVCSYCDGGFIQELHEFVGNNTSPFQDPSSGIMDAFATLMKQRMVETDPDSYIREPSVGIGSGPQFDFLLDSGTLMGGQRRDDFGDFLVEHGLHELIGQQQISTRVRRGPPPAPRASIDAMPTIKISQRHLNTDPHCPVCQDKYELGSQARQMPCHHIYHTECIVPWLVERNSCPVCRLELPSCDSGGSASSSRRNGNTQNQRRWNPFLFLFSRN
ncbi:hypothetical protein ACJIZ3_009733 [Penstemon smallii]|uniref:RING-type E3 ubiquitin transferase n=1 Tax=Penstemon smallii TaxID=265156 RepID=A0ABD3TF99_9LAMI